MKCPVCGNPLGVVAGDDPELFTCFVCNAQFTEEFVIEMLRPDTRVGIDKATGKDRSEHILCVKDPNTGRRVIDNYGSGTLTGPAIIQANAAAERLPEYFGEHMDTRHKPYYEYPDGSPAKMKPVFDDKGFEIKAC